MNKILLALFLAVPIAAQQPAPPFDFSIRNIMRGPELYGRQPQDIRWSADNRWIYEYRRIFEIFEKHLPSRVPIKPDPEWELNLGMRVE